MTKKETHVELVVAAIRRDENAYRELYGLWHNKAYRIGKSICGSQALAEDAVQEALIRFWRFMPGLRQPDAAEGYFLRIVANESRRAFSRRKALPEEYLATLPDISGVLPTESEKERYLELLGQVNLLPAKLNAAVKLHYFGGFTEAETAQMLGISLSSVKMRLARARSSLRESINQTHKQEKEIVCHEEHA